MAQESRISPWVRPAILIWAAVMAFGVAIIAGVIDMFTPGAGERLGLTIMRTLAEVPEWVGDLVGTLFGFYAIGKSGEKMVNHYSRNRDVDQYVDESEEAHDDLGRN